MEKDSNGNVTRGDVLLQNTKNSTVFSEEKLVVVVGVDNLIRVVSVRVFVLRALIINIHVFIRV